MLLGQRGELLAALHQKPERKRMFFKSDRPKPLIHRPETVV